MASINLQGDTSGAITISAPSVAGSNTLTLPATTQTLATQNALGVRNLIINGDMRIDQRNGGSAVTVNGSYIVDRWRYNNTSSGGTFSAEQVSDAPDSLEYSTKVTITAAGSTGTTSNHRLSQLIEGYNIAHLKWGTSDAKDITISFWVKGSETGTYCVAVAASFTGASDPRYVAEYTINTANTWEKKTITIPGSTSGTWTSTNGTGMLCQFDLGSGTSYATTPNVWTTGYYQTTTNTRVELSNINGATWQVTGVQLEVGDTATPFEHRPYDMELSRCQRYYYKYSGNNIHAGLYSSGKYIGHIWFPTIMRTTPTIADLTGNYNIIEGVSNSNMYMMRLADNSYLSTYSASAEL